MSAMSPARTERSPENHPSSASAATRRRRSPGVGQIDRLGPMEASSTLFRAFVAGASSETFSSACFACVQARHQPIERGLSGPAACARWPDPPPQSF